MSICIAAIYEDFFSGDRIITASDRKISFSSTSIEGIEKTKAIHKGWHLMFAGDLSPLVPITEAIEESAQELKKNTLRDFARLCSDAYRKERKQIFENEVLHDYDVETYSEYLELVNSNQVLYEALTKRIKEVEGNWNLLFYGFDDQERPHIFGIGEHGKIDYWDTTGFAAIGSGAINAIGSLSSFRYNRDLPMSDAMYAVIAAKFAAESANGVGSESLVTVLTPEYQSPWKISEDVIEDIRGRWKSLSRIPTGVKELIDEDLERLSKFYSEYGMKRPPAQ